MTKNEAKTILLMKSTSRKYIKLCMVEIYSGWGILKIECKDGRGENPYLYDDYNDFFDWWNA